MNDRTTFETSLQLMQRALARLTESELENPVTRGVAYVADVPRVYRHFSLDTFAHLRERFRRLLPHAKELRL